MKSNILGLPFAAVQEIAQRRFGGRPAATAAPSAPAPGDEPARAAPQKGAGLAAAIYRDAMLDGILAPERRGAGPRAAALWRETFAVAVPEVVRRVRAVGAGGVEGGGGDGHGGGEGGIGDGHDGRDGGVEKLVLRLADGRAVEAVHLPMGRGRSSLCVSTQVGCARACAFCETGRFGLLRNLTAAEIAGQVVAARQLGHRPHTIVFQGMGEPLDNLQHLLQAIAVLTDPRGLAFAHERLTVCTAGNAPGIRALAAATNPRLGLSLSLNAADDALRARLMPIANKHPLAEVHEALVLFRRRKNLPLGVHWCLLPGVNDARADAAAIARFCRGLGRVFVHLIPFNPGSAPLVLDGVGGSGAGHVAGLATPDDLAVRAPTEIEIERFVGWLRAEGLAVRRRITKGRALLAGCGQLGAAAATVAGTAPRAVSGSRAGGGGATAI